MVVIIAAEVAVRILARHADGESVTQIGLDLHMTPTEVRGVLRQAERTQQPAEVGR